MRKGTNPTQRSGRASDQTSTYNLASPQQSARELSQPSLFRNQSMSQQLETEMSSKQASKPKRDENASKEQAEANSKAKMLVAIN